ncbi:hypothetical protein HXA34_20345 [Salipaludibacillus agaradhaerens]|uniref:hypothetical protein n=1 Tax=Salipaludibacillus agaradhaerens TaxID=76935 RepID=UPI0021517F70|nr:hypothetical protein [Salipaludibacillus agaradhaerens]MCR6108648.1 hypothetical protein [Salipaludibacillus agaradhaerens]MCR6120672.1 hypothetical protein [Salipaludibacillus agaradhaerens]
MKKTAIELGDKIYMLDHDTWNIADIDALIIEMTIIERDGELYARGKQGYCTIEFPISDEIIEEMDKSGRKCLFESKAEAHAYHKGNINTQVLTVHGMSREKVIKALFSEWRGEYDRDVKVDQAMREKIKKEFNVDIE